MLAISLLIVISVFSFILWQFMFKPLFRLRGDFSVEKVIPDIRQVNNYLITLSSSAIFLTFFILQKLEKGISHKGFLITSWIGFAFCILIGIAIVIAICVFKSYDFAATGKGKNLAAEKDAGERGDTRKEMSGTVREIGKIKKFLLFLLFSQPIIFFLSVGYLVLFAIKNV